MTSGTSRSIEDNSKVAGYLLGIRVIIPNTEKASEIFLKGFYGKPFGIRKPGPNKYDEVLELSLVEACHLYEEGLIEIVDERGKKLSKEELFDLAEKRIPDFKMLYSVYRDLRSKGFIVRSGLKFGSDYSLYREGPGIDHAPFLVHVFPKGMMIDPIEIVRAGRLSHSVRKKFIIAVYYGDKTSYASLEWYKP